MPVNFCSAVRFKFLDFVPTIGLLGGFLNWNYLFEERLF